MDHVLITYSTSCEAVGQTKGCQIKPFKPSLSRLVLTISTFVYILPSALAAYTVTTAIDRLTV